MGAILLCLIIFCVAHTEAVYKRWLLNTDFGNGKNWNAGRGPCGNDGVIIPAASAPIVYVQENTTMKELVLPKTGEIILGRNVALGFTDKPDPDCKDFGGDVEYTRAIPGAWMNRDNWCPTLTERGDCDKAELLDVDYVPCKYDDVVFPRNHGFYVDLSMITPGMSVKTLKISGTAFTTDLFSSFVFNDTDGKRMFVPGKSTESLQVTRKACVARGGCACGNDKPQISEKICAIKKPTCSRPQCQKSVQPVGMCCRMCGAYFNITKGYGFDLKLFKSTLSKEFFNNQKDVTNIVAVMTGDWVELVLKDTDGEKSKKMAYDVRDAFEKDLKNGGHKYMINKYQLFLDTIAPEPYSARSKSGLSGGTVAAIVMSIIVLLLIIAVVVVVFIYRRTGRALPRIPGMNRVSGLYVRRIVTRGGAGTPQTAAHIDPGFANPMYDNSPLDDDFTMKEMEMIGSVHEEQPTFEATNAGFQNPLYGKSKSKGFKDASKVDTPGVEATASGVASMPTSGASSGKKSSGGDGKNSSAEDPTDIGAIVDFSDTAALNSDSTI